MDTITSIHNIAKQMTEVAKQMKAETPELSEKMQLEAVRVHRIAEKLKGMAAKDAKKAEKVAAMQAKIAKLQKQLEDLAD